LPIADLDFIAPAGCEKIGNQQLQIDDEIFPEITTQVPALAL
jgi:hypothetical protein